MSILSDKSIKAMIECKMLGIKDFSERSLTPNGYDLRIAEILFPETNQSVKSHVVTIPPGERFYVSTIEQVTLPDDVCGQLWLRTTWMRKGILAGLGKVDAGYSGTLTLMGYNTSKQYVDIPIGERFVQIVFEKLDQKAEIPYAKRSGHYQNENGVTLNPIR